MQSTAADVLRASDASEFAYPTPPELHVTAWNTLLQTATATSPQMPFTVDGPSQPESLRDVGSQYHSSSNRIVLPRDDFYRRACWSPDGSLLLAVTESQQTHTFAYRHHLDSFKGDEGRILEFRTRRKSPSPLLDAIWYPLPAMEEPTDDLTQPATPPMPSWCYAESHRDLPIRLTGSQDGRSRASYSIMNHVEKFVGPHSLAFSPDLSRIYCGLHSALAVFPLSKPGLNTHASIPLVEGKRSTGGQRGIISALAATAHPSDPTQELIAVGTFNATVAVYSFDPTEFPEPAEHTAVPTAGSDGHGSLARKSCLAGWREVEGDGITQLKFHPLSPYVLFVASRRSYHIYVYDIRYLMGDTSKWSFRPLAQPAAGVRTAHLLAKLRRPGGASHQRLYFDVDWAGRWLASGDEQGMISLWRIDVDRFTNQTNGDHDQIDGPHEAELRPDMTWKAHQDAIGSVTFHPHEPWLVSVSGSRRWPDTQREGCSDSKPTDSGSDVEDASSPRRAWTTSDSSLKLWDLSQPPTLPAL
ncbi:hypothetical protein PHSY_007289 [Pseudozyma hubeiensis SY62]|uniref:Guanine nucleotide-binding protein beta 5 n=1 Tax=Pseudozyma hubeiensis (strain SY62) TaxID=1305764 RepID=R9PEA4_PSEHS|nr:hypothetical protein PHSY_007289 [Pseudozyma hubeiensis SY62]GAC99686.1 hypothetical protein PHSY_007289 [Pseudozyma hubeiensis SY62]